MNNITVCFLSNYFNRHQKTFSDKMFSLIDYNYFFIETRLVREKRENKDYPLAEYPPYVICSESFYANQQKYLQLIENADVVIIGSAPNSLIVPRLIARKLVFRYVERPLKKGLELLKYPYRFLSWRWRDRLSDNVYVLCASAYTAGDYSKFLMYRGKCFKWGYFPKTYYHNNVDSLLAQKRPNSLIWVGRFIDWKHPEVAIAIAKSLNAAGYSFSLTMIGNGEMFEDISRQVKDDGLEKCVQLLGAIHPDDVRKHLDISEIHLFTSDRQEGWGAVLNEAMNSACASIAHQSIGSAPFLIQNERNGILYNTYDDLFQKVTYLLTHKDVRSTIGRNAYKTIVTEWNGESAANSLVELSQQLLRRGTTPIINQKGICSQAFPTNNNRFL